MFIHQGPPVVVEEEEKRKRKRGRMKEREKERERRREWKKRRKRKMGRWLILTFFYEGRGRGEKREKRTTGRCFVSVLKLHSDVPARFVTVIQPASRSALQDASIFIPSVPSSHTTSQAEEVEEQETNSDKLPTYKTDLEYLDDHFQVHFTQFISTPSPLLNTTGYILQVE